MIIDKGPERPRGPEDNAPDDNLKNPVIDRVCPLCRVFGKNIKFMDLRDDKIGVSLTIVTCMTCRAVYSMNCEIGGQNNKN